MRLHVMLSKISKLSLVISFALGFTLITSAQIVIGPGSGSGGGSGGIVGGTCTNQAMTAIDATGVPTCTTLTSAYVNSSIGLTGSPLSQFASTTSLQLLGVISNETGSGLLVFGTTPTFTTSFLLETAGVSFSATDGVLTLLGLGNGNDESFTIDLDNGSTNQILFGTGTGVTEYRFNTTNIDDFTGFVVSNPNTGSGGFTYIDIFRNGNGLNLGSGNDAAGQPARIRSNLAFSGLTVSTQNAQPITFSTASSDRWEINSVGFLLDSSATPAVSNTSANSCGTTAATIVGANTVGKITVGATAGTSCTVTFTETWAAAPSCTVSNETTANLARATSTTTTTIIAGTFVAGDILAYQCQGYN